MNKEKYHYASRIEILIIALVLAAALLMLILRSCTDNGSHAVIRCGDTVHTLNLENSGEFRFDEADGVVFRIENKKICILSSPCHDKICVNTGYIGNKGQSIICVPEKITVTIKNSKHNNSSADIAVG